MVRRLRDNLFVTPPHIFARILAIATPIVLPTLTAWRMEYASRVLGELIAELTMDLLEVTRIPFPDNLCAITEFVLIVL